MKTKAFIMTCLLLGFGMTQLFAQNGKEGTGSVTDKHIWDTYYIDIPVNCDNAVVDRLFGSVMMHQILHYKDGVSSGITLSLRVKLQVKQRVRFLR